MIAVSITVNGYQGTEAAASDNKITGIDSNGKYDTNTKITFTAAGAGMDNTNPRKGDTNSITKERKQKVKYKVFFRKTKNKKVYVLEESYL